MPVLHKYRKGTGLYVLTAIGKSIATFQLTTEGERRLFASGIGPGETFVRGILLDLFRTGDAYTSGSGPGQLQETVDDGQMVLDFSDDKDSEDLFPGCSKCGSIDDLSLVALPGEDPEALLLCCSCRRDVHSDVSIPLPVVTLALLKRTLADRRMAGCDGQVEKYWRLLQMEFAARWDALAKRRPEQRQLFDDGDGGGRLL